MTGTTWVELDDGVVVEVKYEYVDGEVVSATVDSSDTDIWPILTRAQQDDIDDAIVAHAIGERVKKPAVVSAGKVEERMSRNNTTTQPTASQVVYARINGQCDNITLELVQLSAECRGHYDRIGRIAQSVGEIRETLRYLGLAI